MVRVQLLEALGMDLVFHNPSQSSLLIQAEIDSLVTILKY